MHLASEFGLAASQLHEFHRRAVGLRFDDQKARHAPFICRPGACYSYQNVAFSLIGDAIERGARSLIGPCGEKIFPTGHARCWLGEKAPPGRELVSPHVRTKAGWRAARPNNQYYKVLPARV